jgi:hypothetical protein
MKYAPITITGFIMNLPQLDNETEEVSSVHLKTPSQILLVASRLLWFLGLSFLVFKAIVLIVRRTFVPYELERIIGK